MRTNCLEEAFERGDRYGVWGGTLPDDRRVAEVLGWDIEMTMRFADRRIVFRPSICRQDVVLSSNGDAVEIKLPVNLL